MEADKPLMQTKTNKFATNKQRQERQKRTNKIITGGLVTLTILLLAVIFGFYIYISPILCFNWNKPLNSKKIILSPFVTFEANLSENKKLTQSKYIAHNKLSGPETIIFSNEGKLYTGLANGQIVTVNVEDGSVFKIAQTGEESDESKCKPYFKDKHLISQANCGRPAGLRFKKNSNILYIADTFLGLMSVDVTTREKKIMLNANDPRFGDKPLKFTNDLDNDGDKIYFVDSSYDRDVNGAIEEHVEAQPRGRLFCYNQANDTLELLRDGLFYPNGLQLSPSKDYVLVNENTMARIVKYHLTGEKKGHLEVFANLPGFGDNLRLTDTQNLLVTFSLVRRTPNTSLLDITANIPFVRNFIGLFLDLKYVTLETSFIPKYGLVVEYDLSGNIVKSWHDPTGKVIPSASVATFHNNKLYLGSYYAPFIAVVDY